MNRKWLYVLIGALFLAGLSGCTGGTGITPGRVPAMGEPQEGHGGDILAALCLQTGYDVYDALLTETNSASVQVPLLSTADLDRFKGLLENLPVYSAENVPGKDVGAVTTDLHGNRILLLDRQRFRPLLQPQPLGAADDLRFGLPRAVLHLYLEALGIDDHDRILSRNFSLVANDEGPYQVRHESFQERGRRIWDLLSRNRTLEISSLDLTALKRAIDSTPVKEAKTTLIDQSSGMEVDAIAEGAGGKWVIQYNPRRLAVRETGERGFTLLVFHEYARVLGVEKIDDNYRVSHLLPPVEYWATSGTGPSSAAAGPTFPFGPVASIGAKLGLTASAAFTPRPQPGPSVDDEDEPDEDDTPQSTTTNMDPPLGMRNNRLLSLRGRVPLVPGIRRVRAWYPGNRFLDGRFSADGKAILLVTEPIGERGRPIPGARLQIHLWDAQTGAEVSRITCDGSWGSLLDYALSPDKSTIVARFERDDGGLRLFSTRTALMTGELHPGEITEDAKAWLEQGKEAPVHSLSETIATSPIAQSTDGSRLAQIIRADSFSQAIEISSAPDPSSAKVLAQVGNEDVSSLAFSPDGSLLAAGQFRTTIPVIDIWKVGNTAKPPTHFEPFSQESVHHRLAAFLDNGHLLLVGDTEENRGNGFRGADWNLEVWNLSQLKRQARLYHQDNYFRTLDLVAYSPRSQTLLFFGDRGPYWENNTVILVELDAPALVSSHGDSVLPNHTTALSSTSGAFPTPRGPRLSVLLLADPGSQEAMRTRALFDAVAVVAPSELHLNPGLLSSRDVLFVGTTALEHPEYFADIRRAMKLIPNLILASPLAKQFRAPKAEALKFQDWGGKDRLLEMQASSPDVTLYELSPYPAMQGPFPLRPAQGPVTLTGTLTSESRDPFWCQPFDYETYRDQKFTRAWTDCRELLKLGSFGGVWRCRRPNSGYAIISGFEWGDLKAPANDPDVVRDWLAGLLVQE